MPAYRVGAVAYHPRVVTIWEGFRSWFAAQDFQVEYSSTQPTSASFGRTVRRTKKSTSPGIRISLTSARCRGGAYPGRWRCANAAGRLDEPRPKLRGTPMGLETLRDKRVGFGDSDSPQAYILPIYAMKQQGLDPFSDLQLDRLDRDVGKHGDTGGAEIAQLERLRYGELDSCIISDPTLKALEATGNAADLDIAWTTPPFHHCNFTALDHSRAEHTRFTDLLEEMHTDPALREPMRLESVNRWVEADPSGYADLIQAVQSGLAPPQ